ncbi:hypothetical protein ACRALDRAFT_206128 [Sodiomyces alcalophilus JCM 7366]|uniref:uncharacterized protein n=1 Tax=Sodiomyces alcalophilus JCM 7366 TaxID=591952 RepID=UPI0039B579F6
MSHGLPSSSKTPLNTVRRWHLQRLELPMRHSPFRQLVILAIVFAADRSPHRISEAPPNSNHLEAIFVTTASA